MEMDSTFCPKQAQTSAAMSTEDFLPVSSIKKYNKSWIYMGPYARETKVGPNVVLDTKTECWVVIDNLTPQDMKYRLFVECVSITTLRPKGLTCLT